MENNKLLLGSNLFGTNHRQTISVESWKHLKQINSDSIDLVAIQFENEKNNEYPINAEFCLNRSAKTEIKNATKELPFFWDIVYSIYKLGMEREDITHIGFVNSDCVLTNSFIEYFKTMKSPALTVSRVDIADVSSFDELKQNNAKILRNEIAGFDLWVFDKKWLKDRLSLFHRGSYLLGVPVFDVIYAGLIRILGGEIYNDTSKPYVCHIFHENSSHNETPEKLHNEKTMKSSLLDHLIMNIMFYHLQYNLCRRTPWGQFLQPAEKEEEYTKRFFDTMCVETHNMIQYIE